MGTRRLIVVAGVALALTATPAAGRGNEARRNGPLLFKAALIYNKNDVYYAGFSVRPSGKGLRRLTSWGAEGGLWEDPAPSSDGSRIAWNGPQGLFVTDSDGLRPRRITRGAATDITWAPDGRRIAFVRFSSKRITIIGLDGRGRRTLKTGAGEASEVAWSPTGRMLAYVAGGLDRELYVIRTNGAGRRQLTHTGGNVWGIDWSPDGTRIVFSVVEIGRRGGVWLIRADGTRRRRIAQVAADDFRCCAWSPDGRLIAYTPSVGRSIALVTPSGRRVGGLRIDRRMRAFSLPRRRIDYLDDIEWLSEAGA